MTSYTNFSDIPLFRYGLIMTDPPWQFENWSAKGEYKNASEKYGCMDIDDIKSMNVGHLAGKDCVLWLWATNPLLRQAFEVIDAWGFKYVTAGHWIKRTKHEKLAFGTGYALRSAGEPFLIASNGTPETAKNVRSVIEGVGGCLQAQVREHSRKPDEAFSEAMKLAKGPYLELFSRQERDGWDAFGNQVDKFEGVA